jgi:hypothetical protein
MADYDPIDIGPPDETEIAFESLVVEPQSRCRRPQLTPGHRDSIDQSDDSSDGSDDALDDWRVEHSGGNETGTDHQPYDK